MTLRAGDPLGEWGRDSRTTLLTHPKRFDTGRPLAIQSCRGLRRVASLSPLKMVHLACGMVTRVERGWSPRGDSNLSCVALKQQTRTPGQDTQAAFSFFK